MSLFYIIVYAFAWGIVLWMHQAKIKRYGLMTLIASSYLFYAICSILLYVNFDNLYIDSFVIEDGKLDLFPFIYLFLMLYLFAIPIIKYDKCNITRIKKPSNFLVYAFLILFLLANIYSAISIFSNLREGIMRIMLTDSGGAELYAEAHNNIVIDSGGLSILGFVYSSCADLGIFFIFYYLATGGKKWIIIVLSVMLIMSLLEPISEGLRTEVIMKAFLIISAYSIFYRFYPKSLNKKIIRFGVIGVIIVSIPLFLLSLSRFGERDSGLGGSTLEYIGQANLVFNNYCLDAGGTRCGDRTANLFKHFLGFSNVPESITATRLKYGNMRVDDGNFYTFVGDFVLDYGPVIALLIFILFSTGFTAMTKCKRRGAIPLHKLLLIYFILAVSMQGGFYLFHYSFSANWKIITFFLMYIVLVFDNSRNTSNSYIWDNSINDRK